MSTTTGQLAEEAGANFLKESGWKIIDRNWRNRWCEIDIVAISGNTFRRNRQKLHFVEVKYRKTAQHGTALEYVTATKLRQMEFASQHWIHENSWEGDYQIDALAITGAADDWSIELIENLTG